MTHTIPNGDSDPEGNMPQLNEDGEIRLHGADFVRSSDGDQIRYYHDDSEDHGEEGGDEEENRRPELGFE
jgi:hypothetical protein